MSIPVPSLSLAGWITNPADKIDTLLAHFYEANKSQTALYGNNVSSLPWIIEQYGNNITTVTKELERGLEGYLKRHYQDATVRVVNDSATNTTTNMVKLTIACELVDNNISYSMSSLLEITNRKITKVTNLINTGV